MARQYGDKRKNSTRVRDNHVHRIFNELTREMGIYAHYVSKSYIYEKIRQQTGLCTRTISAILNHTIAEVAEK